MLSITYFVSNRLTTTHFFQNNKLFYKQLRSGASPVFCRNRIEACILEIFKVAETLLNSLTK